jgi:hypothetical protein
MLGNSVYWGKYRVETEEALARSLPSTWQTTFHDVKGVRGIDAYLEITAPDGTSARVAIEFKTELTPATAGPAWQAVRAGGGPGLLVAPQISARTQAYLRTRQIDYFDLTGNAYWRLDSPALFVSVSSDDPGPTLPTRRRRLGGKKAGRLLRYLCDKAPPYSVSELSSTLALDAGNVSRYLNLLSNEGLLQRGARGIVTYVDWESVLRRWSEDYRVPSEVRYHDPRGQEHFLRSLRSGNEQYVLSGVAAAVRYAPYTVDNASLCYCNDVSSFAKTFGLRRSERGSNVVLAVPFDEVVYARTEIRDGLIVAAPSQVAIDLLSGRGRELSQAEELLRWMKKTEHVWRS